MKSKLDDAFLNVKDLTEQPMSRYVLLTARALIAVNHLAVCESHVAGYLEETAQASITGGTAKPIVVLPRGREWELYDRTLLELGTVRDAIVQGEHDKREIRAFSKSIAPKQEGSDTLLVVDEEELSTMPGGASGPPWGHYL